MPDYLSVGEVGRSPLQQQQGFCGQIGGFNLESSNPQACTLTFWSSVRAYVKFMERERESALARYQERKREMIEVALFNSSITFPDESQAVLECLEKSAILRVTDCRIRAEKEDHFVSVEKDVWIPGMSWSEGMLAGIFSKAMNDEPRYLVTTFWKDLHAHNNYHQNVFPDLSETANSGEDVCQMSRSLLKLEPSWFVRPAGDKFVKPISLYNPIIR